MRKLFFKKIIKRTFTTNCKQSLDPHLCIQTATYITVFVIYSTDNPHTLCVAYLNPIFLFSSCCHCLIYISVMLLLQSWSEFDNHCPKFSQLQDIFYSWCKSFLNCQLEELSNAEKQWNWYYKKKFKISSLMYLLVLLEVYCSCMIITRII